MTTQKRPQKITLDNGTDPLVIYADPEAINGYLPGLTADDDDDSIEQTVNVGQYTRRRYPGGPSITVDGHSRDRYVGGYKAEPTTPGRTAWFENRGADYNAPAVNVRQFSFTGTVKRLREYCTDNGNGKFILRTPNGKAAKIDAT